MSTTPREALPAGLEPVAVRHSRELREVQALRECWDARQAADTEARTLVDALRAGGVSWSAIGRATGVSAQGAMYRWGRRRPRP